MTIHFTSDHHFGHDNIRRYCDRPFATIEKMDEALIVEWNKVVRPDDVVYHLGDFTLNSGDMARSYFQQLNGKVYILGNSFHHDKRWLQWIPDKIRAYYTRQHMVTILPPIHTMKFDLATPLSDNPFIALCHFPMAVWPRKHYSAIHLHGHSHGNYQGEGKILDVGVDSVNKIWGAYRPVSLNEVIEYMEER